MDSIQDVSMDSVEENCDPEPSSPIATRTYKVLEKATIKGVDKLVDNLGYTYKETKVQRYCLRLTMYVLTLSSYGNPTLWASRTMLVHSSVTKLRQKRIVPKARTIIGH